MPLPTPRDGENRSEFISRCVRDSAVQSESSNNNQAVAICSTQWDRSRERSMSVNDRLLRAIKARQQKQTEFGYGIITADKYVSTVLDCAGIDACYKYAAVKDRSFNDVMEKAASTLVYSNEDMEVGEIYSKSKKFGVDLPKNTLMVFRHILTSPRKDRDGDILRTKGALVDTKMLLLWQHIPTLPIGKMLKVAKHNSKTLELISAIVDVNEMSQDAAVMLDNDMGRFSHGFRAINFNELKGEDDEGPSGFDITDFEIMEESLVSVPANVDAEVIDVLMPLIENGKLVSGIMKEVGKGIRSKLPVQVAVDIDLEGEDEALIDDEGRDRKEGCVCGSTSKETEDRTEKEVTSETTEDEEVIFSHDQMALAVDTVTTGNVVSITTVESDKADHGLSSHNLKKLMKAKSGLDSVIQHHSEPSQVD